MKITFLMSVLVAVVVAAPLEQHTTPAREIVIVTRHVSAAADVPRSNLHKVEKKRETGVDEISEALYGNPAGWAEKKKRETGVDEISEALYGNPAGWAEK